MPLPSRKKGESEKTFVSRCMKNPQAKKDFPDQKQRTAVCFSRASREGAEFTSSELEALATALPIGNRGKKLSDVPKKKKRPKDKFRLVNDDEVGSSVTGEEDKKTKKPKKSTKKKKGTSY